MYPIKHLLFKINNRNTIKRGETYSKFTIETPEQLQLSRSSVLIVKGMLRPIFCIDINMHGDRNEKLCKNYLKKLFFQNVLVFIDLFLKISLPPLFHVFHIKLFFTIKVKGSTNFC